MLAHFVGRRRTRGDVPGMSRFVVRNARRSRRVAGLTLMVVALGGVTVEAASLTVTWNAPTTNRDGSSLRDLAGYRLYLGTTQPDCPGSSFHAVSSPTAAPDPGETVSTRVTALTADATYVARLTAVDTSGNESQCTGTVSGVAGAGLRRHAVHRGELRDHRGGVQRRPHVHGAEHRRREPLGQRERRGAVPDRDRGLVLAGPRGTARPSPSASSRPAPAASRVTPLLPPTATRSRVA